MGVAQTMENETTFSGGVNFSHLTRVKIGKLSGPRIAEFQTVIRQSVLNRIHVHGDSSPRAEICGVLVGDVYRDEVGPFTLVEHVIEGQASTSSAGQVTFTADTWQHIQLLMDRQYPDLRIVGWYHTHPGHGIFLSDMDVFLHESFFGLPWQSAFVYDPRSGQEGLFTTNHGQAQHLPFLVEEDETSTSDKTAYDSLNAASPAETPATTANGGITPQVYRRKSRFWELLGKFFLAIFGVLLFTLLGALLGLLIRVQHIAIPYWIQRMAHG